MDRLTFKVTAGQLRSLRRRFAVVTAAAVTVAVLSVVARHQGGLAIFGPFDAGLGAGVPVCAYAYLAYARAFTECDQAGLRTRGLGGTRECRWQDVRAIDPLGNGVIRVSATGGRRFFLGAPVNSALMRDPEYYQKVFQLRDCWQAAAGSPGRLA